MPLWDPLLRAYCRRRESFSHRKRLVVSAIAVGILLFMFSADWAPLRIETDVESKPLYCDDELPEAITARNADPDPAAVGAGLETLAARQVGQRSATKDRQSCNRDRG